MLATAIAGLQISPGLLALGLISGMTYGILAVGLVLVYRSSKIVNFAHGEIGAFGAALAGVLVVRWGMPYWIALVAGAAMSAGVAGGAEVVVIRRLRSAPRIMSLVATLGIAQLLLALSATLNNQARSASTFPQPPFMPRFHVGVLLVTPSYSGMLIVSPILVVALAVFLRRSRFGLAIRASAANPERARMAGVSAASMSTLAWGMSGALAAITTVLLIPTRGFITAETLGPVLLLRALTPAVVARMSSLPIALVSGIAIGVVDQVLIFNNPTSGVPEIVLLGIIVTALLFQAKSGGRSEEKEDWTKLQPWPALPAALRAIPSVRLLGFAVAGLSLAGAVIVGAVATNSTAVSLVAIIAFSILGLSVGITTGLGGQLTLGQFALAGVGATASYIVVNQTGSHVLALVAAAAAGAAFSMALGLPALRVRGLLLGVITLSFALACQRWLLSQSWSLGGGVTPTRPRIGPVSLQSTRAYYFWALGVLVIAFAIVRNIWRGGIGLRLRAVRDNEDAARAFSISPAAVKLQGFVISGALAGMAGSVYAHLLTRISADSFDVVTSINTVALSVLGGLGLAAGPLLGAFYIIGIPHFVPLDSAGFAATSLGWLLLIVYFPGGIAQIIGRPRRWIIGVLARRAGVDPDAEETSAGTASFSSHESTLTSRDRAPSPTAASECLSGEVLTATGLVKHFGGVKAVDGVDLTLLGNEILGLLGPNGAGKTTLFELLGGFTQPDAGSVRFNGREISGLSAQDRTILGLVRSFQDAALFPTLTVLETVTLAFERRRPTEFGWSVLGWDPAKAAKQAGAEDLITLMGLGRFANKQCRELSTGTRRVTELACILALEPTVILLDEPSSGIAQRESEALGELLLRLRESLGCSMIVIEHDIPLLMSLSDRVMAMDSGRGIAVGAPDDVRRHPLVVESYLGGDVNAIERSGSSVQPLLPTGAR